MKLELQELLALSKKEASQLAQEQVQEIVEGGVEDPLKVYIESKKISEFYAELNKGLQKPAQEEAAKHGKNGAELLGAKATVVSTPGRWDYANTGDEFLTLLEEEVSQAKKALEERQKFLQSLPETGMVLVDETSGDVVKIYPPVKISGETIKVTY